MPEPTSGLQTTRLGWLTALVAGALLVACGKHSHEPSSAQERVLAEIGNRRITVTDFEDEAARRVRAGRPLPDKDALLREMIVRESMLERARRAGLDQDPEWRRESENLLIARLVEQEVTPRREAVAISPEQVKAEYEANLERYTRPAQVRLAMLFLEIGSKASAQRRAEVRERLESARQLAADLQTTNRTRGVIGFGEIAIHHSDDQVSRYRGGDLGWIEEGSKPARLPEVVFDAGCALDPGTISPVIETPDGLYLVMKTDSRPRTVSSIETVAPALRQSLLVAERKRVEEAFRQETVASIPVQIRTQTLAAVTLPEPKALLARGQEPQPPALPGANISRNGN